MNNATLIFARHGNTFEANQAAYYVGAGSDLPLTAEGECQAQALAAYLQQNCGALGEILSGPLQRTRRTAEIIAEKFQQKIHIDDRLREIHFGKWEGLTIDEVKNKFGSAMLEQWEQQSAWPSQMDWFPSRVDLLHDLTKFLEEQHAKLLSATSPIFAVTSNGIMRLIHEIVTGNPAGANDKVKTGHLCILRPESRGWRITDWNRKPV